MAWSEGFGVDAPAGICWAPIEVARASASAHPVLNARLYPCRQQIHDESRSLVPIAASPQEILMVGRTDTTIGVRSQRRQCELQIITQRLRCGTNARPGTRAIAGVNRRLLPRSCRRGRSRLGGALCFP